MFNAQGIQNKNKQLTVLLLLGQKLGFAIDNGKIHNVSLGQGQEVVAEHALDVAAVEGHWVILQVLNTHRFPVYSS